METDNTNKQSNFAPPMGKPGQTNDGFKIPSAKEKPTNEVLYLSDYLYYQQIQEKPKAVFLDESGRMVDEKGNVIQMQKTSELKINQKSQKDGQVKDLLKLQKFGKVSAGEYLSKRRFFDSSIEISSNKRDKKKQGAFNFIQQGTFVKRGEILRKKQAMEEMASLDVSSKEDYKNEPIDLDTSKKEETKEVVNTIKRGVNLKPLDPIPETEWWDAFFLPENVENPPKRFPTQSISDSDIYQERITHYVQHPVPLRNEYIEEINNMVVPSHLLEKEKKKLRKLKRQEKEKDKQEKVKLGLIPPPLPKVKLSNYMKVMGKEAIADPSRVEAEVRKIIEKRQEAHLKRNEDNKLTRDQKEAKMKRKHERDLQNECRVALFKVEGLQIPKHKFKVDMNAQQLHLGGFCFIADQNMAPDLPNMILIEGGPRAIKKYKRLMLRRINWNEINKHQKQNNGANEEIQIEEDFDKLNIKESRDRKCFLVWEGVVKKKSFDKWRVVDIRSENEAKRLLGEKGYEHYWNMITTFQPQRAEGEEPEQIEKILI